MRVLFWGTPDFALHAIRAVADAGHTIAGVVTRPDRPRGRGRKASPSPVKRCAEARGYPVLTPETPRGEAFLEMVRATGPDISVVVAYGRILPRQVLDAPRHGSVNLHASLLPALRGAAPINWAIARGHAATGVTVMRMVTEMDAGPILARAELPIGATDTAALLSRRLSELGADLVAETLARLEAGPVDEVEQDHTAATYAPKVDRTAARIDWTRDSGAVGCLIRGMDDVPGAWTVWKGQPVKLFAPEPVEDGDAAGRESAAGRDVGRVSAARRPPGPGRVLAADPRHGLVVATGRCALRIGEVLPPGKRRMESAAWLCGGGPRAGDRFE